MAKKQPKQSPQQNHRSRQSAPSRSGRAAAPQQSTQPKRVNRDAVKEEAAPGNILWRLTLILCVGLVVFSLLFASVNGGSKYVGVTYETEKGSTTPTPPAASIDPNVTIEGSDATPIPPSPTPGVDTTPAPEGGETGGGMFINGQPVSE